MILSDDSELTDDSPFPDKGGYKGVKMANMPAGWLVWVYENDKCSQAVRDYVKANLDDLRSEANKKR